MATLNAAIVSFYATAVGNVLANIRHEIDEQFEGESSSEDVAAFIGFVRDFCTRGSSYLEEIKDQLRSGILDEKQFEVKRSAIKHVFGVVRQLHLLVNDICDLKVLQVPSAFIILAKRLIQNVVPGAHVIVKRSSNFNFSFNPVLMHLAFPFDLKYPTQSIAVLDFLFSEGRKVLQNSLIFHEVGHYIWHQKMDELIKRSMGEDRQRKYQ